MSTRPSKIDPSSPAKTKNVFATTFLLSLAVLSVGLFPRFWYSKTDSLHGYFWLAEQNQIAGWHYEELPVSQAAEAVLAADKIVNGQFEKDGQALVRVFSA